MTEEQLIAIIENNYRGDPSHGLGFDYEAAFGREAIDKRLWEVQANKHERELEKQIKEMDEMPEDNGGEVPF